MNKYKAKKTEIDGIVFDSAKEARRYSELKLLESQGVISRLELQPEFPIVINNIPVKIRSTRFRNGRSVKYIADFRYRNEHFDWVIEDVKGFDTSTSRLKRAIVEAIYDIRIEVV